MKLSDGEKLILLMLSELYEAADLKGEIDPEFVRAAIFGDHLWGFSWKYSGIPFEAQETPSTVEEVVDILDMWRFIEYAYSQLDSADKKKLEADAEPFGKNPRFQGFDGNNEPEYLSVAHFLINQLGRFEEFKTRSLNSHMPSLEAHKRMLSVFLPLDGEIRRWGERLGPSGTHPSTTLVRGGADFSEGCCI